MTPSLPTPPSPRLLAQPPRDPLHLCKEPQRHGDAETYSDYAERWRPIVLDGRSTQYVVSDHGRVARVVDGVRRQLTPSRKEDGYLRVRLYLGDASPSHLVHRLVLAAFVGASSLEFDHLNRVRDDNRLPNLEFVTRAENLRRVPSAARSGIGRAKPQAKLTVGTALEARWLYSRGWGVKSIAKHCGLCRGSIQSLVYGKSWTSCQLPADYQPAPSLVELDESRSLRRVAREDGRGEGDGESLKNERTAGGAGGSQG